MIIPVRGTLNSKTRLAPRYPDSSIRNDLSLAFASDVVCALKDTPLVQGVTVLTPASGVMDRFCALGAGVFLENKSLGLNGAIRRAALAVQELFPAAHVAVIMGDLPALTPAAVTEALRAAGEFPRAVLADYDGSGTTLLTVAPGGVLVPAFGIHSYLLHLSQGHHPIQVTAGSPLQRDVDTPEDLSAAGELGLGRHTSTVLAALSQTSG